MIASRAFLVDATRGCSESALFEAFRRGQSTEAFNALFQLHRSNVFQTCFGVLRHLASHRRGGRLCDLVGVVGYRYRHGR